MRDPFEPRHEVAHHPGRADGEQRRFDQVLELTSFDLSGGVHPKEPASKKASFHFIVSKYFS